MMLSSCHTFGRRLNVIISPGRIGSEDVNLKIFSFLFGLCLRPMDDEHHENGPHDQA
jgi:hypothetical protein